MAYKHDKEHEEKMLNDPVYRDAYTAMSPGEDYEGYLRTGVMPGASTIKPDWFVYIFALLVAILLIGVLI